MMKEDGKLKYFAECSQEWRRNLKKFFLGGRQGWGQEQGFWMPDGIAVLKTKLLRRWVAWEKKWGILFTVCGGLSLLCLLAWWFCTADCRGWDRNKFAVQKLMTALISRVYIYEINAWIRFLYLFLPTPFDFLVLVLLLNVFFKNILAK